MDQHGSPMPKKVLIEQLRVGMFLQGLVDDGLYASSLRPPLLIRSETELNKLRASGMQAFWIDPSKGEDVTPPLPLPTWTLFAQTAAGASRSRSSAAAVVAHDCADDMPASALETSHRSTTCWVEELNRAAGIRERASKVALALLDQARSGKRLEIDACWPVLHDMANAIKRHSGALISLMRIKRYEEYGAMHAVAVSALMLCTARELALDEASCLNAGLAGLLMDIGTSRVPTELLNQPGVLSAPDFARVQRHVDEGHELLRAVSGLPQVVLDVALCHHERMDGSGYPRGLAGDEISPFARLAAICDIYDTVTSNRPYKHPWDPAEAIARMSSWKGALDTSLLGVFVRCVGQYPTGSLVRLKSERLAVVLEQNPGCITSPVVRVFFSIQAGSRISPFRLDLSDPGQNDRIVSRESANDWPVGNTEALWSHGFAARLIGAGAGDGRAQLRGPVRE
jgi:HD-GYP domain-containing protein (c-di-GMP phosphodiesterase class II)